MIHDSKSINRPFRPPVGAVSNRTGLACLINSKIHYNVNTPELPPQEF